MRKFSVTFYETNALTITVEADNKREALKKAEKIMDDEPGAFDEETLGLNGNQHIEELEAAA